MQETPETLEAIAGRQANSTWTASQVRDPRAFLPREHRGRAPVYRCVLAARRQLGDGFRRSDVARVQPFQRLSVASNSRIAPSTLSVPWPTCRALFREWLGAPISFRVITLLSNEIDTLGIDSVSCAISLEDTQRGAMTSYATLPHKPPYKFDMKSVDVAFVSESGRKAR